MRFIVFSFFSCFLLAFLFIFFHFIFGCILVLRNGNCKEIHYANLWFSLLNPLTSGQSIPMISSKPYFKLNSLQAVLNYFIACHVIKECPLMALTIPGYFHLASMGHLRRDMFLLSCVRVCLKPSSKCYSV